MNSLVLWMAEQVCSLSAHIGLSACSTTNNFYQVGVAGWIFCGFGLLMLLGIAEALAHRNAAQKKQVVQNSSAIVVTTMPTRQNKHSVTAHRFRHSRVRPLKRTQRDKLTSLSEHGQSAPRA
jgi:hypothetical protein